MRGSRSAVLAAALAAALGGVAACGSSGTPTSISPTASPSTAASTSAGGNCPNSCEVSFVGDGTKTYGTLEIPEHRDGQRLAAALLLPGSGPNDRDGNQAGSDATPDTEKLIADILARQGIMTLRYDKYFTGKTGSGKFGSHAELSLVQDDLRQADAAYEFLAQQPAADRAKLLVVGHSEGGMIALHIAATAATKPAGLALLEPQDERILDLIQIQIGEQLDAAVDQGQLPAAQARTSTPATARAISQFRAGKHVDAAGMAPPAIAILGALVNPPNTRYARTWDAIDPVAIAGKVRNGTRVLITDGTRDTNVPPNTIGPLMRALTSTGITGPGLRTLQGTDHDMHLASQPDTEAVLAPAAITAIQQWAQPYASTA